MDISDFHLLSLFAADALLSFSETRTTSAWWRSRRRRGESLPGFLVRQGILAADAPRFLDLVRKGYLTRLSLRSLLRDDGLERLRERLSEHEAIEDRGSALTAVAPRTYDRDRESAASLASGEAIQVGMRAGHCLLTEKMGQGGYGTVYRALHITLNIPVAVKFLRVQGGSASLELLSAFRAEARMLAQLNHPNVVRVLDFDDDRRHPFVVMELVEGLSLSELIHQSGRLRPDRAIRVIAQAALGLEAAAKLRIVHRDVNPSNILLPKNAAAKISDFGLAVSRAVMPEPSGTAPVSASISASAPLSAVISQSGAGPFQARGTAAYMPPEQARNGDCDHRSDIYSLGATFYQALTGCLPFTGESRMEVLIKHATVMPTPPHELAPDLSPLFTDVVFRMMAKAPEDRYGSYAQLLSDLSALKSALLVESATPSFRPSSDAASSFGSGTGGRTSHSAWKSFASGSSMSGLLG